jgi:hypothetical protein
MQKLNPKLEHTLQLDAPLRIRSKFLLFSCGRDTVDLPETVRERKTSTREAKVRMLFGPLGVTITERFSAQKRIGCHISTSDPVDQSFLQIVRTLRYAGYDILIPYSSATRPPRVLRAFGKNGKMRRLKKSGKISPPAF